MTSGEPKTDYLPADRAPWNWTASLKLNYRKIVAYLPTWRETLVERNGRARREGHEGAMGDLISRVVDDASRRVLRKESGAAFILRLHPKHVPAHALTPPFFCMSDVQGDATHLLQEADIIISDYSSIVIDALLFDRPLALWCEDLDRYQVLREMPYFDFRAIFGWAFKTSLPELRDWLGEQLTAPQRSPIEADGFARCAALFHEHGRGGAGERVLAALRARLEQR